MNIKRSPNAPLSATPRHVAVVGAGMAGIACARTLMQAGHHVTVFEKSHGFGGRMSTRSTPFGGFDHGTQYFTVRDPRFALALQTAPHRVKTWSANAVRLLDPLGRVAELAKPSRDAHCVAVPGMNALIRDWAHPVATRGDAELETLVTRIERDAVNPAQWQLRTTGPDDSAHVYSGFDDVVLAIPAPQASSLLLQSRLCDDFVAQLSEVEMAPCWTLMVAFPQAMQPDMSYLGPQWNAARSTHHRVAWLARESSKPARDPIERWTVQASAAWSREHLEDDGPRVQAKLEKAFAEITGIRAQPAHSQVHRWRFAKTEAPLGQSHLWNGQARIGLCGDWCLGHRVENAFVSGLELALTMC